MIPGPGQWLKAPVSVIAMAEIQSLAQECPCAAAVAIRKKRKVLLVAVASKGHSHLAPAPETHPISYLPSQTYSSHSASSGDELVSEILDRIISPLSHVCLSGKITQPTQPPNCSHMLQQPLFPSSAGKKLPISSKQSDAWEKEGEDEEMGLMALTPEGTLVPGQGQGLPLGGRDQLPSRFPPHLGASHMASCVEVSHLQSSPHRGLDRSYHRSHKAGVRVSAWCDS